MSFPTPHSGYLLLLAGLALFLFACAMLIQQPARFVYTPTTPILQGQSGYVSYMTPQLNDIPLSYARKLPDEPESFIHNSISPPECYEIAHNRWVCSGFIENSHNYPVYQPSITLNLYENSQFKHHKTVLSASMLLLPGEIMPYHLYMDGQSINATVSTVQYDRSDISPKQPERLETTILDSAWLQTGEGSPVYEIHIQIHNPYPSMQHDVRVVVSLLDDSDTITAYRVFNLENLAAKSTETHTFRLIAWINEKDVHPHVLAEGLMHP